MSNNFESAQNTGWHSFKDGSSIGQKGSEEGIILHDEEHSNEARITLEKDGHSIPFAITCGVYGWMVHTRFFSENKEAEHEYEKMKSELARILVMISNLNETDDHEAKWNEVAEVIQDFIRHFP